MALHRHHIALLIREAQTHDTPCTRPVYSASPATPPRVRRYAFDMVFPAAMRELVRLLKFAALDLFAGLDPR